MASTSGTSAVNQTLLPSGSSALDSRDSTVGAEAGRCLNNAHRHGSLRYAAAAAAAVSGPLSTCLNPRDLADKNLVIITRALTLLPPTSSPTAVGLDLFTTPCSESSTRLHTSSLGRHWRAWLKAPRRMFLANRPSLVKLITASNWLANAASPQRAFGGKEKGVS
jgi:hypothetical protein